MHINLLAWLLVMKLHSFQYQVYCNQILTRETGNIISKVDLGMDMMDQMVAMDFGNKQLNGNLTKLPK